MSKIITINHTKNMTHSLRKQNAGNPIILKLTGIALIIIAIILVIMFLMKGSSIVVDNGISNMKSTALVCTSTIAKYPFFTYDDADSREMNVKVLFSGDEPKSISLDYTLFYGDQSLAAASEAHNHAAMNISYATNGLGPDALNIIYTVLNDRMRTNLFINASDINDASAKYFLINSESVRGLPKTLTDYQQNYAGQGLNCKVTE